jgi:hypothetical protein
MDSLAKYTLEMIEITDEVRVKMQRVKEIKAELEKLKIITTTEEPKIPTNNKITCDCECIINKSS